MDCNDGSPEEVVTVLVAITGNIFDMDEEGVEIAGNVGGAFRVAVMCDCSVFLINGGIFWGEP